MNRSKMPSVMFVTAPAHLMIIGGAEYEQMELVNLVPLKGGYCHQPSDRPTGWLRNEDIVGGFISHLGEVLACGGYPWYRLCFWYSFTRNDWRMANFSLMYNSTVDSQSLVLPGTEDLLILGGSKSLRETQVLNVLKYIKLNYD